jgi:uncharacterized protein (TIGR03435 family)
VKPIAWLAVAGLAAALTFGWKRGARGRWMAAPLAIVAILQLLLAAPAPGVTYLFAWPLLAGVAAFALLMTAPQRIAMGSRLAAMLICPAPVFVLLVPLLSILMVALGARGAAPLLGLDVVLMSICVSPQLVLAIRRPVAAAGTPHAMRAIAGACLFLCTVFAAVAQSADAPMAFDVASVKTSAYGDLRDVLNAYFDTRMRGGPGTDDPGQITFKNASLKSLIVSAYGVKRYQISGPDWLDAGGFNIIAKVPPGVSKQRVGVMLQSLLAERFKLTLHHEKRELPVYTLVAGKSGPKMKVEQTNPDAGGTWGEWNGNARWVTHYETMQYLADFLSPRLDRPVLDMTGLTEHYGFTLYWAAENMMVRTATARNTGAEAAEPAPTIFAAVQEQLGLKLERSTSPMDMLVIDHAEKTPTEN